MPLKKCYIPPCHIKNLVVLFFVFAGFAVNAQSVIKRALFIGNSYTYVNNLPQMTAAVAASAGDSLFYDSNALGGYTFQQHTVNATTLSKIAAGTWDFVVLQEQSQLPSFPISQVEAECFSYATMLDSLINAGDPCAETVFFMTWGRKNGDASNCASWPPVCSYQGMDSLLSLRYMMMAATNDAVVSPVGALWHYLRQNFPAIELYNPDESHPSVAGSYAAACSFYSVLFRKDPTMITFNSSLGVTDAQNIRNAAKLIVYDSLMKWHVGEYDPVSSFTYSMSGASEITFTNTSTFADTYVWDFGDGDTTSAVDPVHTYLSTGTYTVKLVSGKCGMNDTSESTVVVGPMGIEQQDAGLQAGWQIYPNPASNFIIVRLQDIQPFCYEIYGITGSELIAGQVSKEHNKVEISSLPDGLYFFRLYDRCGTFSGISKFLKVSK